MEASILSLLVRYGTGAAVQALVGSRGELVGKWACAPQSIFLAYVLKWDPQTARPLIERAIAAREKNSNACRRSIFMGIAESEPHPVLEELAVTGLDDPDPQVAMNAATYLQRYGSETAEQPLWTRYLAWSQKWRGRDKELQSPVGVENPNQWDANLGQALAIALASGAGWYSGEAKLGRIQELAVGDSLRSQIDSAIHSASGRSITFSSGFSVAQYDRLSLEQLKKKLAQFPPGTTLHWNAVLPEPEKIFRELSDAAEQAGQKIVRDPL